MKPTVTTFYGLEKQVDLWLQIIFTSFLNKFVKCVCFEDAAPTAALYFSLFPAAPGRALSLCECVCAHTPVRWALLTERHLPLDYSQLLSE